MGFNETEGGEAYFVRSFNCILKCVDNADASKNPRGVRGFALEGGNFSDWKVQGKIGGYTA